MVGNDNRGQWRTCKNFKTQKEKDRGGKVPKEKESLI